VGGSPPGPCASPRSRDGAPGNAEVLLHAAPLMPSDDGEPPPLTVTCDPPANGVLGARSRPLLGSRLDSADYPERLRLPAPRPVTSVAFPQLQGVRSRPTRVDGRPAEATRSWSGRRWVVDNQDEAGAPRAAKTERLVNGPSDQCRSAFALSRPCRPCRCRRSRGSDEAGSADAAARA
jgi:hypothetical protein